MVSEPGQVYEPDRQRGDTTVGKRLRGAYGIALFGLALVTLAGCRSPNGGWQSPFSSPAPASSPTAPPLASNQASTGGRSAGLFGDLQRRADVQARLAADQEKQMQDLADLERTINKERQALKEKQLELEKEDSLREALVKKTEQQRESQVSEFRKRADTLDTDNRELNGLIASSQQEIRRLQGEMQVMRGQLDEAARQLSDSERSRVLSDQRVQTLLASSNRRGSFMPNNSLKKSLTAVTVEGLDIRQDQDLVRITLASDQLFLPGTAALHQGASRFLDQVSGVISKHYPRQIIGVEAHFDDSSLAQSEWRNAHHLTSAQAMAVFEQLAYRQGIEPRQLFVLGHGANHPLASNQTDAGRARNRRVEIVIYPERPQ